MEFLATLPDGGDELCGFENGEMFGNSLSSHGEMGAQCAQSLSVLCMKPVEQFASTLIGEGFEDEVHGL